MTQLHNWKIISSDIGTKKTFGFRWKPKGGAEVLKGKGFATEQEAIDALVKVICSHDWRAAKLCEGKKPDRHVAIVLGINRV